MGKITMRTLTYILRDDGELVGTITHVARGHWIAYRKRAPVTTREHIPTRAAAAQWLLSGEPWKS